MTDFNDFTGKYQISKTLRFRLIPIGKTLENIKKNGILTEDEQRKKDYEAVKPILDKIYKAFADFSLADCSLDWQELDSALDTFRRDPSLTNKTALEKCQEKYRGEIAGYFTGKAYDKKDKERKTAQETLHKAMFGKELFSGKTVLQLPSLQLSDQEKNLLHSFNHFTTYFSGFYLNRENVFSDEDIATAIPHRLVQDNFPKFIENCRIYQILANYSPELKAILQKATEATGLYANAQNLDEVFFVSFYNTLLQQSGIDMFNQLLGGISGESGQKKIQGLNETINLFLQQHPQAAADLKHQPHKFIPLYKQILSDRSSLSFIPEAFEHDDEVLQAVKKFKAQIVAENLPGKIERLFQQLKGMDLSRIYISHKKLNEVSNTLFSDWSLLRDALKVQRLEKEKQTKGKITKAAEKAIEQSLKQDCSLQDILASLDDTSLFWQKLQTETERVLASVGKILKEQLPNKLTAADQKKILKEQLDGLMEGLHLVEWFRVDAAMDSDPSFYLPLEESWEIWSLILPLYNKVRNYATKKPYSVEKYKLNFKNPTLADGWDIHKENENGALLFRKAGQFYLGIMNAANKPHFTENQGATDVYEKMVYQFFPGSFKQIPKCSTQKNEVKEYFQDKNHQAPYLLHSDKFKDPLPISREIFELNNPEESNGSTPPKKFQTKYVKATGDQKGYEEALANWIDFCREFLKKYKSTSVFDFSALRPTKDYDDISEFYNDVDQNAFRMSFIPVAAKAVEDAVNQNKLYLFQIYNKDFAPGSTGKPNLHTLYWKALFSPDNLENVLAKLNGQAELFYRPGSDMQIVTHRVGEKLVNKKLDDGKGTPIPDELYREIYQYANGLSKGPLSPEAQAILSQVVIRDVPHEIVKDRRYTRDEFFFHVPITFNFKSPKKPVQFNLLTRDYLKEHPETNIIGIDRGERNLIYAVVITPEGKILEQKSFNILNGFDYHQKLTQREKERVVARQAWTAIGKIKDLKQGYLSLVVHEIAKMMVKYQAIVVLENLNTGFKRVRSGISEKAVYQQFEKMLIDKLNFLVFKDTAMGQPGSVLQAYQLTDQFTSFAKMGNQSGFLFYIPSAYTSKIDPLTGFVDPFVWSKVMANQASRKAFLQGFDSLGFEQQTGNFLLHFEMKKNKVFQKNNVEGFMPDWDICLENNKIRTAQNGANYRAGKRIRYDAASKQYQDVYPCEALKSLLTAEGIDWKQGKDILPAILGKEEPDLTKKVVELIRSTLQMRSSNAQTGEDYISSPVMDVNGECFDSRKGDTTWPLDADANGAYHIALKGSLVLQKLQQDNTKGIKNTEWLSFIQEKRN